MGRRKAGFRRFRKQNNAVSIFGDLIPTYFKRCLVKIVKFYYPVSFIGIKYFQQCMFNRGMKIHKLESHMWI